MTDLGAACNAIGPRTPAEFRCMAIKALQLDDSPRFSEDQAILMTAIDDVLLMMENVYVGEQAAPTPCQHFLGCLLLDAIIDYYGL